MKKTYSIYLFIFKISMLLFKNNFGMNRSYEYFDNDWNRRGNIYDSIDIGQMNNFEAYAAAYLQQNQDQDQNQDGVRRELFDHDLRYDIGGYLVSGNRSENYGKLLFDKKIFYFSQSNQPLLEFLFKLFSHEYENIILCKALSSDFNSHFTIPNLKDIFYSESKNKIIVHDLNFVMKKILKKGKVVNIIEQSNLVNNKEKDNTIDNIRILANQDIRKKIYEYVVNVRLMLEAVFDFISCNEIQDEKERKEITSILNSSFNAIFCTYLMRENNITVGNFEKEYDFKNGFQGVNSLEVKKKIMKLFEFIQKHMKDSLDDVEGMIESNLDIVVAGLNEHENNDVNNSDQDIADSQVNDGQGSLVGDDSNLKNSSIIQSYHDQLDNKKAVILKYTMYFVLSVVFFVMIKEIIQYNMKKSSEHIVGKVTDTDFFVNNIIKNNV